MPSLWPFSSGSDLSSSPLQRRLYRSVPSALASKRPSDNDRKQEGNYCINFDAFRLELLLFDTFTERVMSSGEKRYINTIFILFDKTKQTGNMLCTKLRKFRKIVIIFWSCFFYDELQQMSLFIETERGGQLAAQGPLVCEAVHVSWVWDRLRGLHVLHPVRNSFGGHASDLYPNFHRDLGRGLQKSSVKIWEVNTIKSLSFIAE